MSVKKNTDQKLPSVSVIIPAKNSQTTLKPVLAGLEKQTYPIDRIFLLDNNSTDQTPEIMAEYKKHSRHRVTINTHKKDIGLAGSYNEAILASTSELVVTLQSDCLIRKKNDLLKLIEPLINDIKVVASCSLQITPKDVWQRYNFWQKALFSRHVGRVASGRNGRFCAFRSKVLKKLGVFDTKAYRTAGEDGDIFFKLQEVGRVVDVPEVVVDHLHSTSPNFGIDSYVYKENQLAEGAGACFRNNLKRDSVLNYLTPLLRPILIVGCCLPYGYYLFIPLVIVYCFWLSKETFVSEVKNPRALLLFWVNLFLLFSFSFYFIKGFVTKKQRL